MSRAARLSVWVTTVVVLGLLPLVAIVVIFLNVLGGGKVTDFENTFFPAAQALVDGESPYPSPDSAVVGLGKAYVYPPLTAFAGLPLTVLSTRAAGLVMMALLSAAVVGTLFVLGIRDWRCYGVAFLWPPVLSAIQTGSITILLGLGAALTWRYRDQARAAGLALGVSLAAKLIFWPLGIWLFATRRTAAAAYSLVVCVAFAFLPWAFIGFAGLGDYPELLRRLQDFERGLGYTVYALALDLGATATAASVLWIAFAVALLVAVVLFARRGDERRAFVFAVAAALACSPIVWLHYFALLLVAVAVAQPRLAPAWFVPLLMYVSTGTHNGTTLQTAATIGAAILTIAAAIGVPSAASEGGLAARLRQPRPAERST